MYHADQFELNPEFELEAPTLSGLGTMQHILPRMMEFIQARQQLESGKDQREVTYYIFNQRHPELKIEYRPYSKIQIIDKRYQNEWNDIFLNLVGSLFLSLPRKTPAPGTSAKPAPTTQKKDGTWEALKWVLSHIGRPGD